MPSGTCAEIAAANGGFIPVTGEKGLPGGGYFGFSCQYAWDGVSARGVGIGCDGPVEDIHVYNTGTVSGYARLPNKKRGNTWLEVPAGTDQTFTGGTLNSLGLQTYADVAGVSLSVTPG